MREKGAPAKAGGGKGRDARKKKEKGASRTFVASAEEMQKRDELEEQKASVRKARRDEDGDSDDDSEEDESSDEDEGDNGVTFERVPQKSLFGFSVSADGPAVEQPKKKKGIKDIVQVNNPNLKPAQNKVMKAKDMVGSVEQTLSRREREAIEKERAAAHYLKKHLAGETEEAKKDLARLQEVKRRREEAERRKKEEEDGTCAASIGACCLEREANCVVSFLKPPLRVRRSRRSRSRMTVCDLFAAMVCYCCFGSSGDSLYLLLTIIRRASGRPCDQGAQAQRA